MTETRAPRLPLRLFIFLASCSGLYLKAEQRGEPVFRKDVLPFLERYCYDCHSDGVRKGKFALDEHKDYPSLIGDLKHWDHVRQMLVTHVMPPLDEEVPALAERDAAVKWIDENVFYFDPAKPDPGHSVLRRLNRREYDNTVRELLFITDGFRPADEFPQDDSGYGFDNIGSVLSLSPMLMEKYLRAAGRIRNHVLKLNRPERLSLDVGAERFDRGGKNVKLVDDNEALWFFAEDKVKTSFYAPADGFYEIELKVAASSAGPEKAKAQVEIDGKSVGEVSIDKEWAEGSKSWQRLTLEVKLGQGTRKLSIAFVNDFFDENAPEGKRDRNLALGGVEINGPMGLVRPRTTRFLEWVAPGVRFELPAMDLSGEDFHQGEGDAARDTGAMVLASSGWIRHPLVLSEAGKYRFRLKAGALQAGKENAKFEVRLGDKVLKAGEVTAKDQAPEWFVWESEVPEGKHDLRVAFLNDYYDAAAKADRNLWVHELQIEGPGASGQIIDAISVSEMVEKMAKRLFRRPLTAEEQKQWRGLAEQALKLGETPLGTLGIALEGLLTSPAFLFHPVPMPKGTPQNGVAEVDEVTLASRLSYFLWSGPPDESLLKLAEAGQLRANLDTQVKRMIDDYRARALTENFAGQWLQLRDLDGVYRSQRLFPEFQNGLAYSMLVETQMLFSHLLKENRSVMEFITADYTFANKKLAEFYGLKNAGGFSGRDFKKVSLVGTPRRGILTHGSILTLTANPTRTNIVRRGKFVLESIVGIPPPPAPGDVPPLDEEKARSSKLTLRQQFEAHRADASCAGCHALLDPVGFALENFDAIGRWRDKERGNPIDSTGQWVRGQKFNNIEDLQKIIAGDLKQDFMRCLVEHLMTYALGRGLEYSDRPFVQEIVAQAEKSGERFQDIIHLVTKSVPFQKMRVRELNAK
ncbi:MAG: DUF1592 domain-containing protein [Verrucomicrobiaceae bacterium]|nr:DUF1592 domain-containing protein [Verrucomicrobiaceae bacterium]